MATGQIVNATTERFGRTLRIHSAPKFCTHNGILQPIEGLLSVMRDAKTAAYRVQCGDEWITMTPQVRKGELVEAVVRMRRFGDVLRADSGYDDVIGYTVAHSPNVQLVENGWQFQNVPDVKLGVFFDDWQAKWPGKTTIQADSASLDMRGITPDADGRINLDPLTISATVQGSFYSSGHADWDLATGVQVAAAIASGTLVWCAGQVQTPGDFQCGRGFMNFGGTAAVCGKILVARLRFTAATAIGWTAAATSDYVIGKMTSWPVTGLLRFNLAIDPSTAEVGRRDLNDPLVSPETAFSVALDRGTVVPGAETYFAVMSNWDADNAAGAGDDPTTDFKLRTSASYLELIMAGGGTSTDTSV